MNRTDLTMASTNVVRSRKPFIDVGNSPFHGSFLNGGARNVQVVLNKQQNCLFWNHLKIMTNHETQICKQRQSQTSLNPWSAKNWRRCVARLLFRGSLHVTSARLPASFWAIKCPALRNFSSLGSVAKSLATSSRVDIPAMVTDLSTTGRMIWEV